jgi:hypothetical protein
MDGILLSFYVSRHECLADTQLPSMTGAVAHFMSDGLSRSVEYASTVILVKDSLNKRNFGPAAVTALSSISNGKQIQYAKK